MERNKIPHQIIMYENDDIIIFSWDIVNHYNQERMYGMYGFSYDHFYFYENKKKERIFFNKHEYILEMIRQKKSMYEYKQKQMYFFLQDTYRDLHEFLEKELCMKNENTLPKKDNHEYDSCIIDVSGNKFKSEDCINFNSNIYINYNLPYEKDDSTLLENIESTKALLSSATNIFMIGNFNRDIAKDNSIYKKEINNYKIQSIRCNKINESRFVSHVLRIK